MPRTGPDLRTALVTGACSGIGRAIAESLGARGHDLVLVSNREGPLAEAADTIRARHNVTVHAITMDLARPEAAAELHAATSARDLAIDLLVNNAGIFFFGEAADADPRRATAMLQLHVVTPSLLCTHFARDMRARRRGRAQMAQTAECCRPAADTHLIHRIDPYLCHLVPIPSLPKGCDSSIANGLPAEELPRDPASR